MNQKSENIKKNNIYTIEKKEKSENDFKELMNDVNIFNFALKDDEKNNEYLKKFLSNNNYFEIEKRGQDGFIERKEDVNINDNDNYNENKISNIQNDINDQNNIKEILSILKKPLSIKKLKFYKSPFKALFEPIQISLDGKIIFNDINRDNKL
jgi:hypothetical protein